MSEPDPAWVELMVKGLPLLDQKLVASGVELHERPLMASLKFVQDFILEISDEKGRRRPPGLPEILTEGWFSFLFRDIEQWYKKRYGKAFERSSFRPTA